MVQHVPFLWRVRVGNNIRVLWDFIFLPGQGPQARGITTEDFSKPELYANMKHFDLNSALTYPAPPPADDASATGKAKTT
ncbi:unnamed protein product [Dibothriocephalus latus]|uniref:Uncharacterized protein n=1 Tax=Dibothriocephalus latus TaxID=60516 RepID=A0A3P6TL39_DIBLA|nr:unnamed protein product [Dibothriocephalus latus]